MLIRRRALDLSRSSNCKASAQHLIFCCLLKKEEKNMREKTQTWTLVSPGDLAATGRRKTAGKGGEDVKRVGFKKGCRRRNEVMSTQMENKINRAHLETWHL